MKKKIFCGIAIFLALFTCLLPLAVSAESDFFFGIRPIGSDAVDIVYLDPDIIYNFADSELFLYQDMISFVLDYDFFESDELMQDYCSVDLSFYLTFVLEDYNDSSYMTVEDLVVSSMPLLDDSAGRLLIEGVDYTFEKASEGFSYSEYQGEGLVSEDNVDEYTYKFTVRDFYRYESLNCYVFGSSEGFLLSRSVSVGYTGVSSDIVRSSVSGVFNSLMAFVGSPLDGTGMLGLWQMVLNFVVDTKNYLCLLSCVGFLFVAGVGGIRKLVSGV